jgi:lipopolysaccharide/colanic/teichoic acid biosynthesis glycosyltransferase
MDISSVGDHQTSSNSVIPAAFKFPPVADPRYVGPGWSRSMQLRVKRVIDIVVSLLGLVVLSPLFLVVALAIKATSPGPVFFRQIRWGLRGRRIAVFKFRSMRIDACDLTGVRQTVAGDARVTTVGAWLRKSNIDELPQLLNVLKGDMSLVGPRCHPVGMLAAGKLYEDLVHGYHIRHAMRPGLTGLAQVRGLRGSTVRASKARQRIASDLYYVEHFSLWLDVKIVAGTIRNERFGGTGF